ncbi:MAG TPA: hypothetical protein VI299_30300 [Polyangiales bacterium]
MRAALLFALALVVACSNGPSSSLEPLLNRCTPPYGECGKDSTCDSDLGICTQVRTSRSYDYRVQVQPTVATDAGLFATFTTDRATLGDAATLPNLVLSPAVFVTGSVRSSDGTSLEAELVFTPRDANALGGAFSAFTRPAQGEQAFKAQIEPNRTYDVLVYPRGPDSVRYPPYSFELPMGGADSQQDFTYPALIEIKGQILDENGKRAPAGLRIKTRWRNRLLASSSIGTLDAQGSFVVYAPESVRDMPALHELALDLSEIIAPQNVQIVFDLSKQPADGRWTMPVLPQPVQFIGTVVTSDLRYNVDAQLTWISDFRPPAEANYVGQADWCQLTRPGAVRGTFRCSAYVTTSVVGGSADARVSVKLLPGVYQILVAPSGTAPIAQRLATASFTETIESQPDGMQEGRSFELYPATLYDGRATNPLQQPMPAVTVAANALGVLDGLPEVALYNRSDRQTSARDGRFRLAVDVGVYDLVAAPPEGSGYAWVLQMNRRVEGNEVGVDFRVHPQLPVLLRGTALDRAGKPISDAAVDAYALVPDVSGGPDRAVRIAHASTDSEGKFALEMPPYIGDLEDPVDGGVQDAGTRPKDASAQR